MSKTCQNRTSLTLAPGITSAPPKRQHVLPADQSRAPELCSKGLGNSNSQYSQSLPPPPSSPPPHQATHSTTSCAMAQVGSTACACGAACMHRLATYVRKSAVARRGSGMRQIHASANLHACRWWRQGQAYACTKRTIERRDKASGLEIPH